MRIEGFNDRFGAEGLRVLRAADLRVVNGANLGDAAADASEMLLDDVYMLVPHARTRRLKIGAADGLSHLSVRKGSELGREGADVHIDCCATFMTPDGTILEALILVELERGGTHMAATYVLPLGEMRQKLEYALVDIDIANPRARFASLACVSFTLGTRITLGDGQQRPIEEIRVGDSVLTRDNGVQQVRWIGHQTVRAAGAQAPIVIKQGALNNSRELWLSPNQRIFVYQREDRLGTGKAELVVKADLLVNGNTVQRSDGGFVEYYQILFDQHEFIFAEGIATESLIVDHRTSPALPREVQKRLGMHKPRPNPAAPVSIPEGMLDTAIAADLLRKAAML